MPPSSQTTATDHIVGSVHAPVTVIQYGDYECQTCGQVVPAIKILLDKFAGHLCFVYRHFPLELLHPHALGAAEAAEAAGAQERFWDMHYTLFKYQRCLRLRDLNKYAHCLGLDMTRFKAEMDDHIYLQRIREHELAARSSLVRSAPAFFVNGVITDVTFGVKFLFDAVESALRLHGVQMHAGSHTV